MSIYIAMLRGINVSGQKKILMADLRAHLEELGLDNVQTYIQSGNVVFDCEDATPEELQVKIEGQIAAKYGFEVPCQVKTPEKLVHVLNNNPFEDKDTSRLYVTFLSEVPLQELVTKLEDYNYSPEEYILDKQNIYFYSPHGYGNAKMNNNFFENKLKVAATTRNWKTVNQLAAMAAER